MTKARVERWLRRAIALAVAVVVTRFFAAWWCGRRAEAWFSGDQRLQQSIAEQLVAFEVADDESRQAPVAPANRFAGEWALVTHQMVALALAQLCLAHEQWKPRYAAVVTSAALKTMRTEMRVFGTKAWHGEDALRSLATSHGHAYLGYSALAVGMARLVDPAFPTGPARQHDALIRAYERRLLASPKGLIETYPDEAYPTDVAAVAGAIAVHGRATGSDHRAVLNHWARCVREVQIDESSGLLFQRMGVDGVAHDAPRGSGTGLAAYFAGFARRQIAAQLSDGLLAQLTSFWGFGAIAEYAAGYDGSGDIDSGPVVLGVSVSATGFALAAARAQRRADAFTKLYRTTALFGLPTTNADRFRFATGGSIGNALLAAMLTSGPELAP